MSSQWMNSISSGDEFEMARLEVEYDIEQAINRLRAEFPSYYNNKKDPHE